MKNLKAPFVISLLMIVLNSYGQVGQGTIQGYVYNPENEPALFSTIVLMNKDSVFMNGTLSGEDGSFKIDKLSSGNYYIMVRNIEFKTWVSEIIPIRNNEVVNMENIHLEPKINDLDEVVIKGEKALVEIRPDKMVYNVSASVNSAGNNALELIAKSPGVRVDMDNNIILQGKSGVQIYINDRPARISGSDLSNMLEGMRSENIESIEIITNPSAKYDAEGTGGIINIVLKKDLSTGFNGSLNGSYSEGVESRSSIGTNLNYSGEKLNLFTSLNYGDNTYTFNLDEYRMQEDYSFQMLSFSPTRSQGINFSGGMDYKISNEHTLSLDARALINSRNSPSYSNTQILDLSGEESSERLFAETLEDDESNNYTSNLHYSFKPNRSSEFSADVSYAIYENSRETYQPNSYYSLDTILLRMVENQYDTYTDIDLFSTKMDYNTSFGKANVSTGVKYAYISTNNKLEFYDVETSQPVLNEDRSSDFTYLEKVAAAYIILNWTPTDKTSLNAGLRVENTSSLGELISANPTPDDVVPRNYTSFFPNLSFAYDDKENHAISLSFGRRITRPNYQNLNPFESKSSEISAWRGNPFLEPNYINNYQVSYSFKRKLVVSNTYSITYNYFANVFQTVGEKGSILTPRNMEKATVNGLSVSYPLKVTKWWEFSTFLLYSYEAYQGDIQGTLIDLEEHTFNFRMQNNLRLPWSIRMELTGFASSASIWRGTVHIEPYYRINAGLKKSFLNDKFLFQVSAQDIFNTGSNYHFSSDYGGMVTDGIAFFDGRRISISAIYNFGNQKIKARKSKSSLDKELERISD